MALNSPEELAPLIARCLAAVRGTPDPTLEADLAALDAALKTHADRKARIACLEEALHYHEVATAELECVCCLRPYIRVRDDPSDEGRCFACCQTCSMTGGSGKWVRGPQCPAVHAAKDKP